MTKESYIKKSKKNIKTAFDHTYIMAIAAKFGGLILGLCFLLFGTMMVLLAWFAGWHLGYLLALLFYWRTFKSFRAFWMGCKGLKLAGKEWEADWKKWRDKNLRKK